MFVPNLAETNETTNNLAVTTPAFDHTTKAGNLILVWLWYQSGPPQKIASVTDSEGNTYQGPVVGPTPGAGNLATFQQEIWYAQNIHGGTTPTVQATFASTPGAAFERTISAHEYSGADPTGSVEATSVAIGSTVNASSGSVATSLARLIFGAAIFSSHGDPGTGFTPRSTLKGNVTEDAPITVPGPAAATFIASGATTDWIAQMVTLK